MTRRRDPVAQGYRTFGADRGKLALARGMRSNPTLSEEALWELVRRKQINGLRFRRQEIVAGFIVDFFCHDLRLAVEVDGESHDTRKEYDAQRDRFLAQHRICILRFTNEEVLLYPATVVRKILQLACSLSPSGGKGRG